MIYYTERFTNHKHKRNKYVKTALARMIRLWYSPTSKFGSWRVPLTLRAPGDSLKTISYPLFLWFRWATVGLWFSGHTVRNTNELELTNHRKIMGKYGLKTVNIGDLWSRMKRSKTQCNTGAGKEIT